MSIRPRGEPGRRDTVVVPRGLRRDSFRVELIRILDHKKRRDEMTLTCVWGPHDITKIEKLSYILEIAPEMVKKYIRNLKHTNTQKFRGLLGSVPDIYNMIDEAMSQRDIVIGNEPA